MLIFETILALLLGAALLSMIARAAKIPYPALLALGGIAIALVPGAPHLDLPPDLNLALFVAPVLLDAAHDASLRDLKRNWRPVLSLVVGAVGLTTIAVAVASRWFVPGMPWGAAIALGALVAPPDAVAAIAVLRQVTPPHRLSSILEGESLLNDASSLLIYKLAVTAVISGGFRLTDAAPAFGLVVFGSVVVGWIFAHGILRVNARIEDPPTATIIQFVATFGVWLVAERLHLSGVVTIVVFGLTTARKTALLESVYVRVSSFATWETVTFVLNVLAFTLIGLQLRPVLDALNPVEHREYLALAIAILAIVILVRLAWVLVHGLLGRLAEAATNLSPPATDVKQTVKAALVVGWSGMRGIVTIAAALALPPNFPYRDFILLTAFTVVLGTLVIQGLTLRPLLLWLRLPEDNPVQVEVALARGAALKAAMSVLDGRNDPAASHLITEYCAALSETRHGGDSHASSENVLRREIVPFCRRAIAVLRSNGQIGDEAYRQVEEELDWLELSARS